MTPKHIYIVAEPDGAGKTSVVTRALPDLVLPALRLSADELLPELGQRFRDESRADLKQRAAKQIGTQVSQNLQSGKSFVVEMDLSSPQLTEIITQAKKNGYRICLAYNSFHRQELTPKGAQLNRSAQAKIKWARHQADQLRKSYADGGSMSINGADITLYPVEPSSMPTTSQRTEEKIIVTVPIQGYRDSHKRLAMFVPQVDTLFIIDNSSGNSKPTLVAHKSAGLWLVHNQNVIPAVDRLLDELQKRGRTKAQEYYAEFWSKLKLRMKNMHLFMLPGFAASFLLPTSLIETVYPGLELLAVRLAMDGAKQAAARTSDTKSDISQQDVDNTQKTMKMTALGVTAATIGSVYLSPLGDRAVTMLAHYLVATYSPYVIGCSIVKMKETAARLTPQQLQKQAIYMTGFSLIKIADIIKQHRSLIVASSRLYMAGRFFNHAFGRIDGITAQVGHWAGELPVIGGKATEILAVGGMSLAIGSLAGSVGLVVQKAASPLAEKLITTQFAQNSFSKVQQFRAVAASEFGRIAFPYALSFSVGAENFQSRIIHPKRIFEPEPCVFRPVTTQQNRFAVNVLN